MPPLVLLALLTTLMMIASGCNKGEELAPSGNEPSGTASDDDVIATVGTMSISRQQLLDRLLASYGSQVLRSMILAEAVSAEAKSLRIEATDEELDRELAMMSQGYENEEEFYRSMNEQLGMTRKEVREDARYRLLLEKLTLRTVTVTAEEIDRYLDEHREQFDPVKKYQLAHILVQTEKSAREILTKLEQGEDFAELARAFSLDDFTADQGGELGWVESDDPFAAESVLTAAASMQVGEVSGPIPTDQGFAIIRLNGRSQTQSRPMEEIREEARKQLALGKGVSVRDMEQQLLRKYEVSVKDSKLQASLWSSALTLDLLGSNQTT
jgi:foldase protein PrsA